MAHDLLLNSFRRIFCFPSKRSKIFFFCPLKRERSKGFVNQYFHVVKKNL